MMKSNTILFISRSSSGHLEKIFLVIRPLIVLHICIFLRCLHIIINSFLYAIKSSLTFYRGIILNFIRMKLFLTQNQRHDLP